MIDDGTCRAVISHVTSPQTSLTKVRVLLRVLRSSKHLELTARLQKAVLFAAEKLEVWPRREVARPIGVRAVGVRKEVVTENVPLLFRLLERLFENVGKTEKTFIKSSLSLSLIFSLAAVVNQKNSLGPICFKAIESCSTYHADTAVSHTKGGITASMRKVGEEIGGKSSRKWVVGVTNKPSDSMTASSRRRERPAIGSYSGSACQDCETTCWRPGNGSRGPL